MLMYFQLNALMWSVHVDVLSVECLCVESVLMYFQLNALVWSVHVDVLSVECLNVECPC